MVLFGPWIFPFVFGSNWQEAGIYIRALGVMYLFQFVTSPTGSILDVLERQDLHLLRELFRLAITSGGVILAWKINAQPTLTITIYSMAGILSYIFYVSTSYYAIKVSARRSRPTKPAPPKAVIESGEQ
jgi:O-antigen/teichoic acid export membrane protein